MTVTVSRLAAMLAVIYLGYAGLWFFGQRAVIYPGRTIRVSPAPPAGVASFPLRTAFGRSEAWLLPATTAGTGRRPAVLFFHGNGEVIDFLPAEFAWLRNLGMQVLLVEYPGYGRSSGSPSETSITAAAVAAFDLLAARDDVDPRRIVAFGRSLGGGAAAALARQRPLAAVVLQSPFTSLRPFARRMLLPALLLRDRYDNRAALRGYEGPVLVLHGRDDDIVPFAEGRDLAAAVPHGRLVALSCGHNDWPVAAAAIRRAVSGFLVTAGIIR
ncbi:alpha/beta hydrolase [Geotalea uraniireducens]|uniref:Alpha/beta hydrolase n=1 Tax=Geotalea uraniireducens TaxID=351604 RepID=A0ABN6VWY9_9BACT|nr:alpha/beta hydrolase [Geotalea uraniireducens]BDV44923.1 alpha/beta hydrolase [Geotalea uraniireducens]